MNKRPLIGMTCYKRDPSDDDIGNHYHLHDTYSNSLHSAGATAVILPYTFDDWDILDGVLFCGGGDLNPARGAYDAGDKGEAANLCDLRDDFETRLFHAANERGLPMLGICRGCQFLNYVYGGKNLLDIPGAGFTENHRVAPFGVALHPIVPVEGTFTGNMLKGRPGVASYHHQAVKTLGRGFTVTATSPEGVIEAIEHENGRVMAFQFHPERTGWPEPFVWLTELAKKHREGK